MDMSWANSGRWWRTGKPGVLQYVGSQRVRHDLATEQQYQPHVYIYVFQINCGFFKNCKLEICFCQLMNFSDHLLWARHHAKDFICLGRRKWRRGRNRDYSSSLCPWLWLLTHKSTQEHKGYSEGRWWLPFCTSRDLSLHDSSVQSLSCIRLFVTLWTAGRQASVSITSSQCLLRLVTIESVMPSSHLILCHPILLPPSIFPRIRIFSNDSVLRVTWPKYWSFSFSLSPSYE